MTSTQKDRIPSPKDLHNMPITIEGVDAAFPDSFDTIADMPETYHISTKPSVSPVQNACKHGPIELKESIEEKVKEKCDSAVISPVISPK